jgi:hypothetical protein
MCQGLGRRQYPGRVPRTGRKLYDNLQTQKTYERYREPFWHGASIHVALQRPDAMNGRSADVVRPTSEQVAHVDHHRSFDYRHGHKGVILPNVLDLKTTNCAAVIAAPACGQGKRTIFLELSSRSAGPALKPSTTSSPAYPGSRSPSAHSLNPWRTRSLDQQGNDSFARTVRGTIFTEQEDSLQRQNRLASCLVELLEIADRNSAQSEGHRFQY